MSITGEQAVIESIEATDFKVVFADFDDCLVRAGHRLFDYHRTLYLEEQARRSSSLHVSEEEFMEVARGMVGGRAADVFSALWPEEKGYSTDLRASMAVRFSQLAMSDPTPASPLEGVSEALLQIHEAGMELRLITNRGQSVKQAARSGGIDLDIFASIDKAGDFTRKSEAMARRLGEAGIDASLAVMLGDAKGDMSEAKKAGVRRIGIPMYVATKEQLVEAGAEVVADTFAEATAIILARG